MLFSAHKIQAKQNVTNVQGRAPVSFQMYAIFQIPLFFKICCPPEAKNHMFILPIQNRNYSLDHEQTSL